MALRISLLQLLDPAPKSGLNAAFPSEFKMEVIISSSQSLLLKFEQMDPCKNPTLVGLPDGFQESWAAILSPESQTWNASKGDWQ